MPRIQSGRRRPLPTTCTRRSSSASRPLRISPVPPLPASPSAASSLITPSSAGTAPFTRRYSLASLAPVAFILPWRHIPPLPPPCLSRFPSTSLPAPGTITGVRAMSATAASSSIAVAAKLIVNWERLVWDPLSQRGLLLPPITSDLLASIGMQSKYIYSAGASSIRPGGIEDTSFRVIYWVQPSSRLGVFIFSSDSGCWSVSTSISWGDLGLAEVYQFISEQYTNDCFYWKSEEINTLIKLDMNSMRFHTIDLPPGHEERQIIIVESGESRVAMFSMIYEGTSVDYYTFSQNGSENSHEWHLKSTIPLPGHDAILLVASPDEGYIFLECTPDEENARYSEFLSLDIKSFNIQRVSRTGFPASLAYPYFGFPPSMSPKRI